MLDFHSCDIFNPCLEKKTKTKQNNNNTKNSKKTRQVNT